MSFKKTICMLVTSSFTYDTRVQKEAKALTQAGHKVTVFALYNATTPHYEERDGYYVERIQVHSRDLGKSLIIRAIKYLEFCLRAIWRITWQKPDVIHAHDIDALVPGYIAARLIRAKLVYDSHELWAVRQHNIIRYKWLRSLVTGLERFIARRATGVITVNPTIAQHLAQQFDIPTPTVLMHSQEYHPPERNNILRQEFGIPSETRIIIYAGLMKEGRGLDMLIKAATYLDQAVVVLMGPERIRPQLENLAADLNLEGRVFFRDPVTPEKVQHYVAAADLGVMPTQNIDLSYYYAAGNKLFHYLMAGIPAAVSDHPEKRRIVKTYNVGVVFDETDPQDIARVINTLLNDTEKYQAMCKRAQEVTQNVLNWTVESQTLLVLYDNL